MNRMRLQFRLRSLLLLTLLASVLFGLLAARYVTVRRFNAVRAAVSDYWNSNGLKLVSFAEIGDPDQPGSDAEHSTDPADWGSPGRCEWWMTDYRTYCVEAECRSSSFFGGRPVVAFRVIDRIGTVESNHAMWNEIVDWLPAGVAVEVEEIAAPSLPGLKDALATTLWRAPTKPNGT